MGTQDIFALLAVFSAAVYIAWRFRRAAAGRGGCNCGDGKGTCGAAPSTSPSIERRPFVPLDQLQKSAERAASQADSQKDNELKTS